MNYTITFYDSISGSKCESATVSASSCETSVCSHFMDVSSSSCYNVSNVNVTVFARYSVGDGPESKPAVVTYQELYINGML